MRAHWKSKSWNIVANPNAPTKIGHTDHNFKYSRGISQGLLLERPESRQFEKNAFRTIRLRKA